MSRRVEEDVEVRAGRAPGASGDGDEGGEPGQFLWRGRLYRVTQVVDHWQERRAWWRTDDPAVPGSDGAPLTQREVWRVEARAGRAGAHGIYDLVADGPAWRLLRTQD